ncbi:hypothetical protein G4228_004963 [Cervus hanglu yarkandensis]|nr:hypothetical protein G4228_004963 [Cervus hanglu yarkandensis]
MSNTVEAGTIVGGPVNNDTVNTAQVQTSKKGFCSVRHGLALILHLCNLSISTQQMNMSIALPVMVNNTALSSSPNASTERPPTDSQDNWNETLNESKAVAAVYDWSPEIQGIILSSLNYGSFLAPIPSSYMAEVFGTRYLSGTCMFITSVLALFTPLAADTGVTVLIVLRVIQGIVQVVLLTSQYSIWARWAPPQERSQLTTIAVAAVLLPAVLFTSVFWVRSSFSTAIAFLTISSAFKSFAQSGALVNFMDIAPRYSALLRALSQIFSYMAGAISPTVNGFLISQDPELGWRNVFLFSAAVGILGLIFYLIVGQAEVQDWAKYRHAPTSERTDASDASA